MDENIGNDYVLGGGYMEIDVLLVKLAKPAQIAIQNAGITTIEQLSKYSEEEISELHGIGKNAMNIIKLTLSENGLTFASNSEAE